MSKITLIGMERFLNPDHSVFENMVLPEGIDREVLIGSIILRCQEFELLFSDPDFMTAAVNVWSRKNYWTFDKWVKLLNKQYDPLYNKDYYEDIHDTHEGAESGSGSNSLSDDHTRTDNLSHSSDFTRTDDLANTNDVTTKHSEAAFNSSSLEDKYEDVVDQDGTQTGTVRNAGTDTDTGTQRTAGSSSGSYSDSKNDSYVNSHTYHGYGNIGITSAQELFMREANDVARWNMYEHIADLFCQEFFIMVY